ncbi:proclotting enzyme-like [Bombus vosnesenskii]|uniref:Phenoloxidase-activating factor 2 n=1 Tax=Bombus vosnesenskii TaxID=207650 RepID=A0A6J3JW87_9HYME|nr:proclotting enzyme-like [Bombus vosnesenskii]XP_050484724.1 proclotting enzyme-like [Bombus huntii]
MEIRKKLMQSTFLFCVFCAMSLARSSSYGKNTTDFAEHIHHQRASSTGMVPTSSKCAGLNNESGHCEHLKRCLSHEYGSNFTLAINHSCVIDQTYTGICCSRHGNETRTNSMVDEDFVDTLPQIAASDDKKQNEVRIVWSGEHRTTTSRPKNPALRGCGTTLKSQSKLVGGRPAYPTKWPWMVALLTTDNAYYCGGVLVTDRHVLTAAHCVYRFGPQDIKVRLGEYDFATSEETRAVDFTISEIRIHRDFVLDTFANDIAIVKLYLPTVFDSYIWPVCLPPIGQTFEYKDAVITGWGARYYGGSHSPVLMEVEVPVWPQSKCTSSIARRIANTTICAGAYNGGGDACQGDSGGPLLHQLANGRWVNIGIVSWGIRCGEPGRPGIYTRVNSYLDWIFENAVF